MRELKDLEVFVAVFETGSFTLAGERLLMTKSTVSKRIAALEDSLGIQLVKRSTRNISFTTAGSGFYGAAKRLINDYSNAVAEVQRESNDVEGLIRVGAPLSFGRLSLAPALISFISKHPKILVQIVLSDKFSNVVSEGLDLVIRLGEMKDSNLSGRSICNEKRFVCAAPSYIDLYGSPESPEELIQHRVLQYSGLQSGCWWPFVVAGKVEFYDIKESFTADNGEILAEASAAGDGIVMLPEFILQPYLQSGKLVKILPQWQILELNLHLLWPKHAPISRRLRLLIDHLVEYYNHGQSRVDRVLNSR